MGRLSDAIQAAIQTRKMTVNEFADALKKHIPRSSVYTMLAGTCLPREHQRVDEIASILQINQKTLRTHYAYDKIQQLLQELSLDWKDMKAPQAPLTSRQIPLYRYQDILLKFDESGKPARKPSTYVPAHLGLGPHAYAISVPDTRISPKAEAGDICIFDPSVRKPNNGEYALVRTRQAVHLAKLEKDHRAITIYTKTDKPVSTIPKADVLYKHLIVEVRSNA